jgi:hypothetical protein
MPLTPRLALALALAAVTLLATAAIAGAQPSRVEPAAAGAAAAPAPATALAAAYLEPGVEVGATRGGFYGALQLDGGHRLADTPIWLHARLAHGGMAGVDEVTMSSDFTEARLGLEARTCGLHGHLCLVGGLDAAYRHQRLVAEYDNQNDDLGAAIARLGLDAGGQHLRFRTGLEAGVDQRGSNSLGLTTGLAYAW